MGGLTKENGLDSATGLTEEVSKRSEPLTIPFTLCTGEAGSRCNFGNCVHRSLPRPVGF